MKEFAKRIEELALDLTSQFSVLDTPDEVVMAEKVYGILQSNPYFQKHPELLRYVELKGDSLGRKSVMAIVKGEKKPCDKTVVMIGHMDTVGISDYGNLAEFANQPHVLMEKFKEIQLPPEAKRDLESGEYLFGRGIFDMKSGDAILIALLEKVTADIENFEGNLIYGAVCEAAAAEFAARRAAMNAANKNADEMIANLTLRYNRARQSMITQEITEIIAGSEAL